MGGANKGFIRRVGKYVPLSRVNVAIAFVVAIAALVGLGMFDYWMIRVMASFMRENDPHVFRNGGIVLKGIKDVRWINELYVDAPEHECRANWKSTGLFETNCQKRVQKLQNELADKRNLILGGFSAAIQMKEFAPVAAMLKDLPISMGAFVETRFVPYPLPCDDKKACLPESTATWNRMPTLADRYTEEHMAVRQNDTLFIDRTAYGKALMDIQNSVFYSLVSLGWFVVFHVISGTIGVVLFCTSFLFLQNWFASHESLIWAAYRAGGTRAVVGFFLNILVFQYHELVAVEQKRAEKSRLHRIAAFRAAFLENYDTEDAFLCFPDARFRGCRVGDLKKIQHCTVTTTRSINIEPAHPTVLFIPLEYYHALSAALSSALESRAPKPAPVPDAAQ